MRRPVLRPVPRDNRRDAPRRRRLPRRRGVEPRTNTRHGRRRQGGKPRCTGCGAAGLLVTGAPPPRARPWRLIWPLVAPHRWRIVLLSITSFLGGLVEAAILVLVARLAFTLATDRDSSLTRLGPLGSVRLSTVVLLVVAAGLPLVRFGLSALASWQTATLATRTVANLRRRLFGSFLRASWGLQSEERLGHLQELMTTYAFQALTAVTSFAAGVQAVLVIGALLASALAVNPLGSLVVGVSVVLLTLLLQPLRSALRRRSRATAKANAAFATKLTELSTMAQEIRVFGVEPQVAIDVEGSIDAHGRALFRSRLVQQLAPALYQTFAFLLIVGVLAAVYASGFDELASLGAVILIMLRSLSYGQTLQTSIQALHEGAPYIEAIEERHLAYEAARQEPAGTPVTAIDKISFEHVSFEYEPGRPVLTDVSFCVARRELIGIVGPSGSGKSTLVQLLLRLREPTSGRMEADGHDVRELSIDGWYEQVAFVPQEPRLIAGTVSDNIRFFRPVDPINVERAARLAHIHDEIVLWPDSYETKAGERGGQLSGGQRQRICIARALVGDPDVLLFDEPTSALDARSEALFRETLESLSSRATLFVIAHRLSTLLACNRIMVVHEGRLQQFDEPVELERSSPFFREVLKLSGLR
ncbi:MAG: ABC transporter ATP-binding protein [Acidimicrobiia bacterium]